MWSLLSHDHIGINIAIVLKGVVKVNILISCDMIGQCPCYYIVVNGMGEVNALISCDMIGQCPCHYIVLNGMGEVNALIKLRYDWAMSMSLHCFEWDGRG